MEPPDRTGWWHFSVSINNEKGQQRQYRTWSRRLGELRRNDRTRIQPAPPVAVGSGGSRPWNWNRHSGLTRIHSGAVQKLWLSPSRSICRKTELNHNIRYGRSLRASFYRQCFATIRARRATSKNSQSYPLLAVGRKPRRALYVQYYASGFVLAEHDERSLSNNQRLPFGCLKPPNEQQTTEVLLDSTFQTVGVYSYGHTRSVCIIKNQEPVHLRNNGRYVKPTKKITTVPTTTTAVAMIFVDHCLSNFGILSTIHTTNSPRFTSKFFQAIYAELLVTPRTTTEYYPQRNRPGEG